MPDFAAEIARALCEDDGLPDIDSGRALDLAIVARWPQVQAAEIYRASASRSN